MLGDLVKMSTSNKKRGLFQTTKCLQRFYSYCLAFLFLQHQRQMHNKGLDIYLSVSLSLPVPLHIMHINKVISLVFISHIYVLETSCRNMSEIQSHGWRVQQQASSTSITVQSLKYTTPCGASWLTAHLPQIQAGPKICWCVTHQWVCLLEYHLCHMLSI